MCSFIPCKRDYDFSLLLWTSVAPSAQPSRGGLGQHLTFIRFRPVSDQRVLFLVCGMAVVPRATLAGTTEVTPAPGMLARLRD